MAILDRISSILSHPKLYLAYQTVVGGIEARRKCVTQYVGSDRKQVVLDIGCGPGYALTWLVEPEYYGFDISKPYIEHAKNRFGAQGQFFCQPFGEQFLDRIPPADVALLMGVVHHLDDNETVALFRTIRRALKSGGRLLTLDGCYRDGQSSIARWLLRSDRGGFVRDEIGYRTLAGSVFSDVRSTVREDFFRIPYTTIVMECRP